MTVIALSQAKEGIEYVVVKNSNVGCGPEVGSIRMVSNNFVCNESGVKKGNLITDKLTYSNVYVVPLSELDNEQSFNIEGLSIRFNIRDIIRYVNIECKNLITDVIVGDIFHKEGQKFIVTYYTSKYYLFNTRSSRIDQHFPNKDALIKFLNYYKYEFVENAKDTKEQVQ